MKKVLTLARREFANIFHSWIGVMMTVLFFFITGVFFTMLTLNYAKISINPQAFGLSNFSGLNQSQYIFGSFFINISILLLFLIPVLTMRAFSEERRQETLEILFTYPLSDFEIVAGKQLGLQAFFTLLVVPLAAYGFVLEAIGGECDWSPAILGFLGFWLLGSAYLSAGVFISSLTKNPMISAFGSFSMLVLFWILDWADDAVTGPIARFFSELSPLEHYRNFTVGVLDARDLIYFGFFFFYFLFLTIRSIETRNWKT